MCKHNPRQEVNIVEEKKEQERGKEKEYENIMEQFYENLLQLVW